MSRQKLSEFAAKKILIDNYQGFQIRLESLDDDIAKLDESKQYVVKVDQGVKQRGKKGLLELNVAKTAVRDVVMRLQEQGFRQFLAEPMQTHDAADERYLSFEISRDGINISYSPHGGIDIEENANSVVKYTQPSDVPLPDGFCQQIVKLMKQNYISFIEINPLVVDHDQCYILDAAVLVDSAGQTYADWQESDIVEMRLDNSHELAVKALNDTSTAALSFRLLNPNGAIWLLLSGGGASITIADEAANEHKADLLGNYGEYSGSPTSEETYLYTREVIAQALESKSTSKALVIAGGVANFTDVKKTFSGIIRALKEFEPELIAQSVKVFVRRGGPNEVEGLALMKSYLETAGLFGSVHGTETILTDVIHEALEYVDE